MCTVKFFLVIQAIYILPATAFKRLHVCRKANVIENTFPIERISKIAKAVAGGITRQLVGRENNCFGDWYFNIHREGIIEEFFICTPPEWVIDNSGTSYSRVFKVGTIKWNILANAIYNNGILCGF